mmetsp:Transcript_9502/g.26254  ORF Transcript_9502/g.26254 Transcript_9502/m.26254 type:complete len:202 (-) Transcript_9502:800-1405(-)
MTDNLWFAALLRQHEQDLILYRRAHENFANRALHWILIPCETAGFLLMLAIVFRKLNDWERMPPHDDDDKKSNYNSNSPGPIVFASLAWTLGILSLVLYVHDDDDHNERNKDDPSNTFHSLGWGILACAFHVSLVPICNDIIRTVGMARSALLAGLVWTLAWGLQVGVGHYCWEKNQPNVANLDEVSYLAMLSSVVIAWKS